MFKGVRLWVAASSVLAMLLLASCGGGQQVQKYVPTRIVSFGDEASVITDAGLKYTNNGIKDLTTTGNVVTIDCTLNPIWNQIVAQYYGLVFPQCNPTSVATSNLIFAANGAKVADVTAQIDAFLGQPNVFTSSTLVTMLAGQNDVLEQYALVKAGTVTEADAEAAVGLAGSAMADQVNRVGLAGAKVLISTVADVGTTPFGLAENTATPGRAAFLSLLTSRFNSKLRVGLINDGKMTGLVLSDESISSGVKNPGVTFVDVTTPVCDPAKAATLLDCNTSTLIAAASASTGDPWLWADQLHLSSGGQRVVGNLAVTRATGNPF